jgi:hypothetical protein
VTTYNTTCVTTNLPALSEGRGLWYLQVQVYFPVISQPGFGLVRTVVKDNNDTDRGQESVRCAADSLLWQW